MFLKVIAEYEENTKKNVFLGKNKKNTNKIWLSSLIYTKAGKQDSSHDHVANKKPTIPQETG
jgi:hypothetical protein